MRQRPSMLAPIALALLAAVAGPVAAAPAAPRVELESTSITGARELPRVLYILPWQDPAAAELAGRPFNTLIEEVLSPVDRDVLEREITYHEQLEGTASVDAATDPTED